MRFDLFIIWGHGMRNVAEIMVEIRAAFEIVMIYRHKIQDMDKFVDEIYSCDSYPLSHLREKTRYLLDTPQECFIVLVKNHHVHEVMVGSGEFRKPQCSYLWSHKNKIRTKFNPPNTQHHVIHGTDYESQVHHILEVVKQGPLSKYTKQPHPDIPYPWHLAPVSSYKAREVEIDTLRINVTGQGLMKIEDSPHYKFVAGDRKPYEDYFSKYMGWVLREDHFVERFDQMIKQWTDTYDPILINRDGHILDGGHRAAMLKQSRAQSIKTYMI